MKKILFIFLFLLIIGSYFVSADSVQTGKATLTVVGGCDRNSCSDNLNYSSNMTGDITAENDDSVSLLTRIINFFIGIFD